MSRRIRKQVTVKQPWLTAGITATVSPGTITTVELGGDITTAGKALLDDASAADQRTTLGAMASTTTLDAIPTATSSINFNQQQATSFRIENRTSDPGSPAIGEIWLRTDL